MFIASLNIENSRKSPTTKYNLEVTFPEKFDQSANLLSVW